MHTTPGAADFRERLQRLDTLIQKSERLTDPASRAHSRDLVRAVLDVHGTGLERLLQHLADAGPAGQLICEALAHDEVVGGMLLLYGLHPHNMETRVRDGLARAREYMRSQGGDVELVGIEDGVVRLRVLQGGSCSSSAAVLRSVVERSVLDAAPDAVRVELDGLAEMLPSGLLQLGMLHCDQPAVAKHDLAVEHA